MRASAVFCQKRCDMFSEDFLGRFEGKVAVVKDGTKDNLDYTAVDLYILLDCLVLL